MSAPPTTVAALRPRATIRKLSDFPDQAPQWVQVTSDNKARFLWEMGAQTSDLHPDALLVLLCIACRLMAGATHTTFTGEQLASLTHKSPSNVATAVTHLERHGFIHRRRRRFFTEYWPMLPLAIVDELARHCVWPTWESDYQRLLTTRPLPPAAGSCAPDGTERPRARSRSVAGIDTVVGRTGPAMRHLDLGKPATETSSGSRPPSTERPLDQGDVQQVYDAFGQACRNLESIGLWQEANGLRNCWVELRGKDRVGRQVVGLLAEPDGRETLVGLLAGQRWRNAGPGALASLVRDAWVAAGSPDIPAANPSLWLTPSPDPSSLPRAEPSSGP